MRNLLMFIALSVVLFSCKSRNDLNIDTRPNIVLIMGDDIGITNISAYSHGLMGY